MWACRCWCGWRKGDGASVVVPAADLYEQTHVLFSPNYVFFPPQAMPFLLVGRTRARPGSSQSRVSRRCLSGGGQTSPELAEGECLLWSQKELCVPCNFPVCLALHGSHGCRGLMGAISPCRNLHGSGACFLSVL